MRREVGKRRRTFVEEINKHFNKKIKTMEIGVAAGDFSEFLLNNLNIEQHTMVDPWTNSGDNKRSQWFTEGNDANLSYKFVLDRTKKYKNVKIVRKFSYEFLIDEIKKDNRYDFIYVDGDHHSEAVYFDLMLSWEILNVGGILGGDDYNWKSKSTNIHEVKKGVDKFENMINQKPIIINADDGYGMKQYYFIK